jgi:hypothetical protein
LIDLMWGYDAETWKKYGGHGPATEVAAPAVAGG